MGNRACVECHPDEHETYLHTNHSRSLEPVVVSQEPPDGEFYHELSGRHYRVYRDGETLKLQEYIEDDSGDDVVLVDQPAQYALGSGNYARMYFVKIDDYLVESPMTWYPRRELWGMSAGFEKDPQQPGPVSAAGTNAAGDSRLSGLWSGERLRATGLGRDHQ